MGSRCCSSPLSSCVGPYCSMHLLFSIAPVALPQPDRPDGHPLSKPGMTNVAKKLSQQLKSVHLDDVLSLQIVKNLLYLGKCFYPFPVGEDKGFANEPALALLENESSNEDKKHLNNPLSWLFSKLSYQPLCPRIQAQEQKGVLSFLKLPCCSPSAHCLRVCQAYTFFGHPNIHRDQLSSKVLISTRYTYCQTAG